MADPQKFIPGYDYTGAASFFPASKFNQDFANVATSIDEVVNAIKDVRRSDGKLKNGIVTLDSLDPQVAAGVGSGALASAVAAASSAADAEESRDEAEGFSVSASGSATAAAGSANSASDYASTALTYRDASAAAAALSQTARDFANLWATAGSGVTVDDGVNAPGYSAYHWAQVALDAVTGALPDNSVSTSKIVDLNVTTAKLADGSVTNAKLANGLAKAIGALTGVAGAFLRLTGPATAVVQSIVGTVSQSSGTPTGAIVERGFNANGEYVRFADGTQICWFGVNVGPGNNTGVGSLSDMYRTTTYDWTFPVAFINNLYRLTVTPRSTATGADGFVTANSGATRSTTGVTGIQAYRGTNVSTAVVIEMIAVGRWF